MRLIDADELLEKAEYISTGFKSRGMQVCFHGVTAATIENAPTIDPEGLRSKGHWERPSKLLNIVNCTACKTTFPGDFDEFRYCPHCGAKMEDKSDD